MCFGHDGDLALDRSLAGRGTSRRSVLRGAGGLAAAGGLLAGAAPAGAVARTNHFHRVPPGRISIQLYTLRAALGGQPGFEATLEAVADDGYPRVELAGYYGRTAAQLRRYLDGLGLRASSSHEGISADRGALHTKLQNAATLGQRYVVVPYLASSSRADWERWVDQMNAEAALARSYGLRYGYHNHAHEFTTDLGGGTTPWQVLTEGLDPALVHLEADLYWVVTGGIESGDGLADPERFAIDTIAATPQVVRQFHVKDKDPATGDMADLGTGFIDFARIFAAHAVEEYIVENDTPDVTPLRTAQVGYDYLRRLRF